MARYERLDVLLRGVRAAMWERRVDDVVIPFLTDLWLEEYQRRSSLADVVETIAERFHYLFDVRAQRLIAAWGVSHGKHSGARPAARMKGHPLSDGPAYHRGHAIPHTLGGGTDINLVPQRGALNIGEFRVLEKAAVATPGALYFTYWLYERGATQRPSYVEQGLLLPGHAARISRFQN